MTREFEHYDGCRHDDPDNCSACALTDIRQERPDYAAWPLAYMGNGRTIPAKWRAAFIDGFHSKNQACVKNLRRTMQEHGARFPDRLPPFISGGPLTDEEAREEEV